MFTFLCRLHIGGENGDSLQSPLLTEAERGVDAEAEGILHSTSDAQLPSLFTDLSTERRLYYCKMNSNCFHQGHRSQRHELKAKCTTWRGLCALEWPGDACGCADLGGAGSDTVCLSPCSTEESPHNDDAARFVRGASSGAFKAGKHPPSSRQRAAHSRIKQPPGLPDDVLHWDPSGGGGRLLARARSCAFGDVLLEKRSLLLFFFPHKIIVKLTTALINFKNPVTNSLRFPPLPVFGSVDQRSLGKSVIF